LQELNERFYVIMMEDSSDFVAEEQFLLWQTRLLDGKLCSKNNSDWMTRFIWDQTAWINRVFIQILIAIVWLLFVMKCECMYGPNRVQALGWFMATVAHSRVRFGSGADLF
jgi:hypothetical protein